MAINWGMGGPQNNALQYFQFGNQLGSQVRERQDERAKNEAFAKVASGDKTGMNDLMRLDPRMGMQMQQFQWQDERYAQETQAKQQEQKRADLPLLGRLLDHAKQGPEAYAQAKAVAQQYGIDTTQLPEAYDPQWIAQQAETLKMLSDPAKQEALSAAGKLAMDMGYKPVTPEFNAKVSEVFLAQESKPYRIDGETRLYTPRLGGAGQVQGVTEGATATNPQTGEKIQFKGGQWVPMGQGGGGARVTGNFLEGL